MYKPPNSSLTEFKNSLKPIFDNICRKNKDLYLAEDFNIIDLDYENNLKEKTFVHFAFQNSLISLINKPTRVTRTNATAIDHILTNAFLNKQIKAGINKTEILDHFPIFLITHPIASSEIINKRTLLYKKNNKCRYKRKFQEHFGKKNLGLY